MSRAVRLVEDDVLYRRVVKSGREREEVRLLRVETSGRRKEISFCSALN
jgi:hypothetical protein